MQFQKERTITTKLQNQNTIEESHSCLVKTILQAVERTIPKTSSETKRRSTKNVKVRAEYRKNQRDPTNRTQLRIFQCRRAIKQSFQ